MSEQPKIRGQPALIVSEQNSYDYLCIVPVDPATNTFIIDTDLCSIKKGSSKEVAARLARHFSAMGYRVQVVKS